MIGQCSEYLSACCICLYVLAYIAHAFQSEFTLYSCLNVNELLAQSMREI